MSELSMRLSGFLLSLALTLLSYFMIVNPQFFHFDSKEAIAAIISLAIIQSIVQLVFFIDVWQERKTFWNLAVFISTASIIFIVIAFSIWIIDHLNYHMH